ncbi:MAG: aldehyde dehydrogenase family protein [Desulfosarcinaceae bacterium]
MVEQQEYNIQPRQFINGKWIDGTSGTALADTNPYDLSTIFEIPLATPAEVDQAYKAAEAAKQSWARTPAGERGKLIQRVASIIEARKEEIIGWMVKETGSTRIKAEIEWNAILGCADTWSHMPQHLTGQILTDDRPGKYSFVFREPIGVIGVISPWNFPMILSMRSVIPAIALGNTVVLKPASDSPVTGALLVAKMFEEAGCPEGVLNAVVGAGGEIGDYFVKHPIPRLISFTGSTEVGKRVGQCALAGTSIKRLALELGGNSPLVVLDDANVEAAAGAAVIGRFLHQGQICMSVNRLIVDKKVHQKFIELFVDGVSKLKVGDPAEPDTIIGPIINQGQLNGLKEKIKASQSGGTKLLYGGEPDGLLLPPHVFSPVDTGHILHREETFGPLVPITIADNEQHALTLANDTEHGLSSAVFTRNMERGLKFARNIYAGMTHINDITVDDQPLAPFGGEKNSGLGRFNGDYLMEEFTRAHWITYQGTGPE